MENNAEQDAIRESKVPDPEMAGGVRKMFYVTMTDKFLSGWGGAKGKTAKYILPCKNYEEAEIVAANAKRRGDMKNINIVLNRPKYDPKRYQVTFGNKKIAPIWYKKGSFSKRG